MPITDLFVSEDARHNNANFLSLHGEVGTIFLPQEDAEANASFLNGLQSGWLVVNEFDGVQGGDPVTQDFNVPGRFFTIFRKK